MSLWPAFAAAQDQMKGQMPAQSNLAAAYDGMIVCEKAPGAADILHVPFDLAIRGNAVQFARPVFNPRGTRVFLVECNPTTGNSLIAVVGRRLTWCSGGGPELLAKIP